MEKQWALLSAAQGDEELSNSAVSANQFSLFSWYLLKITKKVFLFSHSTLLLYLKKKILEKNRMRNCNFTRSSNPRQVEVMKYLINIFSGDLSMHQCPITFNYNISERQICISLSPPSFTVHVTVLS